MQRADFNWHECDTLGSCFRVTISYGLRLGGGIGDYLSENGDGQDMQKTIAVSDSSSRFWLDLTFFMLVVIILLNIIFGIIIDNFAELRDKKKERMIDTKEFCFVCGIARAKFDKLDHRAYEVHITQDHCMWNYLRFMVYIWNQDRDNDDGLEQYVRGQIESSDAGWLPDGVCMGLDTRAADAEEGGAQAAAVTQAKRELATRFDKVGGWFVRVLTVLSRVD